MLLSNLPLALLLFQASCPVSAATNFSVGYQDPLFTYTGNWTVILGSLDRAGGHMMTQSQNAYATITYTFASVYFLSALWPYVVTTNYGIDGNTPMTVDMQDHSVTTIPNDGSPTVASGVVGKWISDVNQQHTIHITVPPGGPFAIVDTFIFEVLDPSDILSITSTTSTTTTTTTATTTSTASTSSSDGATFGIGSPSPLPALILSSSSPSLSSSTSSTSSTSSSSFSSSSLSTPVTSESRSFASSPTQIRNLAISMSVVGTLLVVLFIFFLWRSCARRKDQIKNDGYANPITSHYHPVPTTAITPFIGDHGGFNSNVPLYIDTASPYGSMQSSSLQRPSKTRNHYPNSSSPNGVPSSPLYASQTPSSSLPRQIPHRPTTSDSPPMYTRDSITFPDSSVMLIGRNDTSSVSEGSRRPITA